MAATALQIQNALTLSGVYSLIDGSAVVTDSSNWASISIASPDTVKILFYIQDSTGQLFYKNAGYDAAVFTSPDISRFAGASTYSFTLPTDAAGDYLTGQYTFNCKIQVVEGSDTTTTSAVRYQNVNPSCNGITASVAGEVSYNTAIVSVTDNTNYKAYTALANTLTLYPPADIIATQPLQTQTFNGAPATLVYEPPDDEMPYTGVWTWRLSSDVTYTDAETGASTTCRIVSRGTFSVAQSQLCVIRCKLDKYRTEAYAAFATKETSGQRSVNNYIWADAEFHMAFMAQYCGLPQTTIDKYIDKIYSIIGESWRDCACGCDEGTSQPLVPTNSINGTDGTDGLSFLQGTGVPAGGLGNVGDSYVNVSNYDLYKKTGASTWTLTGNIQGATGATGAAGATGATGASGTQIIVNEFPNTSTVGSAGYETLATETLTAGLIDTNESELQIYAAFTTVSPVGGYASQFCRVTIGGVDVGSAAFFSASANATIELYIRCVRTGASAITCVTTKNYWSAYTGILYANTSKSVTGITPNTANTITVLAQGAALAGTAITLKEWRVAYLPKV